MVAIRKAIVSTCGLPWIYDNNRLRIVNLIGQRALLRTNKFAINKPGGHDKRAIMKITCTQRAC